MRVSFYHLPRMYQHTQYATTSHMTSEQACVFTFRSLPGSGRKKLNHGGVSLPLGHVPRGAA